MSDLISIIVPFFNSKEFILETVDSIRCQTFKKFEVIFVNDGSTDHSRDLVVKATKNDDRFKIIDITNSGPAIARIEGLKKSTGDFVFFLDSDDLIHERALETLYNQIQRNNCDVAIANYTSFYSKNYQINTTLQNTCVSLSKSELIDELSTCKRIQNFLWGKLFKRDVLHISDFDISKKLGEDIATTYKIFDRCDSGVFVSGSPLVFYRKSKNSLSHRINYSKLNDYCDALVAKTSFIKEKYPEYFKFTFDYNLDFYLLVVKNYDMSLVTNIPIIKGFLKETAKSLIKKIKLYIAFCPRIVRKIFKENSNIGLDDKKRIAVINTYNSMSTGRVAKSIAVGVSDVYYCKLFYGRCYDKNDGDSVFFGSSRLRNLIENVFVKITGKIGGFHKKNTKRLIKYLEDFKPDIIHLHNIHGNFLNYEMLFNYIKDKPVVVTMHDCFWLTGRCAHFLTKATNCQEWKNECNKCKFKNLYMKTLIFDRAHEQYALKQKFFNECKNLTLVCLSNWQQNLFSNFHNTRLIPNGFDFQYDVSKQKNKKITIVGVSQNWTKEKGIEDFNYLSKNLDQDKYRIILIGKRKNGISVDKNINMLGIMPNKRTIELISKSDIFVNPTYVDTFPTVLIESLYCRTPIITYDVGGCRDIVGECGQIIERGNLVSLLKAIKEFNPKDFDCIKINEQYVKFSKKSMILKYRCLYDEVIESKTNM